MPIDSAARIKLNTSKSENFGTTPLRGILPFRLLNQQKTSCIYQEI
jgi:hypothetical protein